MKSNLLPRLSYFIFLCLLLSSSVFLAQAQKVPNTEKKWAWLGFERPVGANPIVRPDTTSRFFCPMWGRVAQWENSETFNPAATVFNGGIALLYRAEDNIAQGIGSRTSRIGYAFSEDGIHFQHHGLVGKRTIWSLRVAVRFVDANFITIIFKETNGKFNSFFIRF